MSIKGYPRFQQHLLSSGTISQRKTKLYCTEDRCLDLGRSLPFFRVHQGWVEVLPSPHIRDLQVVRDELLSDHLGCLGHERGDLVDALAQLFPKQRLNLRRLGFPTDTDQEGEQEGIDFALRPKTHEEMAEKHTWAMPLWKARIGKDSSSFPTVCARSSNLSPMELMA